MPVSYVPYEVSSVPKVDTIQTCLQGLFKYKELLENGMTLQATQYKYITHNIKICVIWK